MARTKKKVLKPLKVLIVRRPNAAIRETEQCLDKFYHNCSSWGFIGSTES